MFDSKANAEIFKTFFSNLASELLKKLPTPLNKFSMQFVSDYYKIICKDKFFSLSYITEDKVFNILNNVEPSKAAGLDDLTGIFLKDVF